MSVSGDTAKAPPIRGSLPSPAGVVTITLAGRPLRGGLVASLAVATPTAEDVTDDPSSACAGAAGGGRKARQLRRRWRWPPRGDQQSARQGGDHGRRQTVQVLASGDPGARRHRGHLERPGRPGGAYVKGDSWAPVSPNGQQPSAAPSTSPAPPTTSAHSTHPSSTSWPDRPSLKAGHQARGQLPGLGHPGRRPQLAMIRGCLLATTIRPGGGGVPGWSPPDAGRGFRPHRCAAAGPGSS
jgi:hypothetical protein